MSTFVPSGKDIDRKWYVVDASGQGTVLGRHLGTRTILPHHRKVAYGGHFTGVERLSGREEGHPRPAPLPFP